MNKQVFTKQGPQKEFVFIPLTVKIGEDTYVLTWEKELERFNLRKNNILLFSDVSSSSCIAWAKEKGVKFIKPTIATN